MLRLLLIAALCTSSDAITAPKSKLSPTTKTQAVQRGGAPVQIGVVSWGAGSTYDVYMKVAGHRAWIESVIEG